MIAALRRRWRAWQQPAPALSQTLGRKGIYILPTRTGVVFAVVLLAMALGAMNYDSSLIYALVFLLISVGIVSILHTYRNLVGLRLRAGPCMPVFAGEPAQFSLFIDNPGAQRLAIVLRGDSGPSVIADLAAHTTSRVMLPRPTAARGRLRLGRTTIETRFPLGLFRAWSYLHIDQSCLVYPVPDDTQAIPNALGGFGDQIAESDGLDDFASLREYRAGDSLRRVHWKAYAREQGLVTKNFAGQGGREVVLDFDMWPALAAEARLSRLTRLVQLAHQAGLDYELRLSGVRIAAAQGADHQRRCLEALALYGLPQ